jgi:hypothetical protein
MFGFTKSIFMFNTCAFQIKKIKSVTKSGFYTIRASYCLPSKNCNISDHILITSK